MINNTVIIKYYLIIPGLWSRHQKAWSRFGSGSLEKSRSRSRFGSGSGSSFQEKGIPRIFDNITKVFMISTRGGVYFIQNNYIPPPSPPKPKLIFFPPKGIYIFNVFLGLKVGKWPPCGCVVNFKGK